MNECVLTYLHITYCLMAVYSIISLLLMSEIERQLVKTPLAAAISSYYFDVTHPPNPCMKCRIDHHTGNYMPYLFR